MIVEYLNSTFKFDTTGEIVTSDLSNGTNCAETYCVRQNAFEIKGRGQNVWDEMKGDEVILGQNERGQSERDEMSVERNEWDEMNGTKCNGTK